MAAALALSITLSSSDPPKTLIPFSSPLHKHPFALSLHKPHRLSTTTTTFSSPSPPTTTASVTYSLLEDSFRPSKFLSNDDLETLKKLQDFSFCKELKTGSISIRVMRQNEMEKTVKLLAESFADSMLLPNGYVGLLRFLVRQYLIERRGALPHAVTLVGFYREGKIASASENGDAEEEELAGTVEVCFDKRGANASPPTPSPPKDQPYICNMTVTQPLRRKGIGWNLLKASEELISQITRKNEVYLHCRMIDSAPFNMYRKAGYEVVKTDSILVLLLLQRRKHLMRKELPVTDNTPELSISGSDMQLSL